MQKCFSLKAIIKDSRGETVISFSIIMPILAALMGLLLTIFNLMYASIIVIDANRDGARHKALNMESVSGVTTEQVIKDSIGYARLPNDPANYTVDIDDLSNYVTVTTKYYQPSLIPKLPQLFGANEYPGMFTIEAKTAFKKEKP